MKLRRKGSSRPDTSALRSSLHKSCEGKGQHVKTCTVSITEILLKKYKDGLKAEEEKRERDGCVNENKEQFYKSKVGISSTKLSTCPVQLLDFTAGGYFDQENLMFIGVVRGRHVRFDGQRFGQVWNLAQDSIGSCTRPYRHLRIDARLKELIHDTLMVLSVIFSRKFEKNVIHF